jgi:hypothetical protein
MIAIVIKKLNIFLMTIDICSSSDLWIRLSSHLKASSNTHLIRDITKYGLASFEFIIVTYVTDITMLLDTEQKWLDWLFNLSRDFRFNLIFQ